MRTTRGSSSGFAKTAASARRSAASGEVGASFDGAFGAGSGEKRRRKSAVGAAFGEEPRGESEDESGGEPGGETSASRASVSVVGKDEERSRARNPKSKNPKTATANDICNRRKRFLSSASRAFAASASSFFFSGVGLALTRRTLMISRASSTVGFSSLIIGSISRSCCATSSSVDAGLAFVFFFYRVGKRRNLAFFDFLKKEPLNFFRRKKRASRDERRKFCGNETPARNRKTKTGDARRRSKNRKTPRRSAPPTLYRASAATPERVVKLSVQTPCGCVFCDS